MSHLKPKTFLGAITATFIFLFYVTGAFAAESSVANPRNPFDYIGASHNECLDYVIEAVEEVGHDSEALTLVAVQRVFDYTSQVTGVGDVSRYADMSIVAAQIKDPDRFERYIEDHMTGLQHAYYLQLGSILESLGQSPSAKLGKAHIEALKALEEEIMTTLEGDEARPLLIGAAVGRYSWEYWTGENEALEGSPWNNGVSGPGPGAMVPWLEADAKGAVAGAIGGAIAGSLAGGVGALPGAGVGGVAGGAGASAVEVIWSFF